MPFSPQYIHTTSSAHSTASSIVEAVSASFMTIFEPARHFLTDLNFLNRPWHRFFYSDEYLKLNDDE